MRKKVLFLLLTSMFQDENVMTTFLLYENTACQDFLNAFADYNPKCTMVRFRSS